MRLLGPGGPVRHPVEASCSTAACSLNEYSVVTDEDAASLLDICDQGARAIKPADWAASDVWSFYVERLRTHPDVDVAIPWRLADQSEHRAAAAIQHAQQQRTFRQTDDVPPHVRVGTMTATGRRAPWPRTSSTKALADSRCGADTSSSPPPPLCGASCLAGPDLRPALVAA